MMYGFPGLEYSQLFLWSLGLSKPYFSVSFYCLRTTKQVGFKIKWKEIKFANTQAALKVVYNNRYVAIWSRKSSLLL